MYKFTWSFHIGYHVDNIICLTMSVLVKKAWLKKIHIEKLADRGGLNVQKQASNSLITSLFLGCNDSIRNLGY